MRARRGEGEGEGVEGLDEKGGEAYEACRRESERVLRLLGEPSNQNSEG